MFCFSKCRLPDRQINWHTYTHLHDAGTCLHTLTHALTHRHFDGLPCVLGWVCDTQTAYEARNCGIRAQLAANLASWVWHGVLWQRLQFAEAQGRSGWPLPNTLRATHPRDTATGSQATNSISLSSLHTDIFVNLICAICCQTTSSTIYKCGPATGCLSAHTHIPRRLLLAARTTDDKDGIDGAS